MRPLVIGADGFVGRWLVRHLLDSGDDVVIAVGPRFEGGEIEGLTGHTLDVRDATAVDRLVGRAEPDAIYYLAGVSASGARDDVPRAIRVAVVGAANVIAAAGANASSTRRRIVHVGSSHMYGRPAGDSPIREDAPVHPTAPYGAAKAAAEAALLHLGPSAGVEIVAVRPFNHVGPGQQPDFVVPALAQQMAAIARGEREPEVRLGSADVRRDFTDVRDVVRAYRLLAVAGTDGEAYNVASGIGRSIREIAERMLAIAGVRARLVSDPGLTRGDEPEVVIGDAGKLRAATGWAPRIDLDETLADVLASAGPGQPAQATSASA